jgi:uncharacterized protein
MTRFSQYTIFSKIRDSKNYFLLNPLSGNADILTPEEAQKIDLLKSGEEISDASFLEDLKAKGYCMDEKEESILYKEKYLDFIDSREQDEIQLFFVPNYSCNFSCTYCYQDQYSTPKQGLNEELILAFFKYVKTEFGNRKKYVTLFGGEPLLGSLAQKRLISYFLQQANEAALDVCIVTNGYTLAEYTGILKTARIREIQVTLDGTAEVHDARRFLKGGGGTFDQVVKGIDACLDEHLTVNLRMVADKENINNLPELARFAIEKGWTKNPLFKTQIGRNYELHHCQSAPDKLFDRVSLYENLYTLTKTYPFIAEFYRPSYSVSKYLAEQGSLPDPLFDSCPACKTEWAFDYTGSVYPCTATVGKQDELLGTFYPETTKKKEPVSHWENRDVTSIPSCKDCSVQLACGGGCGAVAKNNSGNVCSPDCRPVKKLLELGFSAYLGS